MKILGALILVALVTCVFAELPIANRSIDINLTKQIAAVLAECQNVKPGMTRAELLKTFTFEGGLSVATHRVYVYRGCPYVKIDVRFILSGPKQDRPEEERPTDTISSISKPYLERSIAD